MINAKMKRINIFLSRIHKLKTKNVTNLKKPIYFLIISKEMINTKMKRINIFLFRIHKLKTKNVTNFKKNHLFLNNIQRND